MKNLVSTVKILMVLIIVGALGHLGYTVLSGKGPQYDTEVGEQEGLKGKVSGVTITDKNAKGEILSLTADTALVWEDRMEMQNINGLLTSPARKDMTIQSEVAVLENSTDNARFSGNVVVTSKRPFVLKTDELYWDEEAQLLTSDRYVDYSSNVAMVTGVGFLLDMASQDVTVLDSVNALFN